MVVNTIYKRDSHSVVSMVYSELIRLMSTKRGSIETFRDFEMRFSAQLSRLNGIACHAAISDTMSALMLLANASAGAGQRVSILAAASPFSDAVEQTSTTDSMLELVHYDAVATVVRQCDDHFNANNRTLSSDSAAFHRRNRPFHPKRNNSDRTNDRRQRMTPDQIKKANNINCCNKCGKLGLWFGDHHQDGSLPDGVMSSPTPITDEDKSNDGAADDGKSTRGNNASNTITFNNATAFTGSTAHHINNDKSNALNIGPLVDGGGPYSAIGAVELDLLSCYALPN